MPLLLRVAASSMLFNAICIGCCLLTTTLNAQPPAAGQRLLDRQPFDQVILKAGQPRMLEVLPLELPQRPLAEVPASGRVNVRLVERPAQEFTLAWTDVAQVRVYEQLLLDEARRLTAVANFDEAYDYFARLTANYPTLPGLDESLSLYLRLNALALYQAKQHDRALALLLTLYQKYPNYAGLAAAVERVAGEIIQSYLRDGNYAAARGVLIVWQDQFRGLAPAAAAEWQKRFETAANKHADEATRLVEARQYIAARKAVSKAVAIWPELEDAARLTAQIQREFPFVTVGVFETAPIEPQFRIDSWPAIRANRLTQRLIAEQIDFGAEGGVYRSPFGELVVAESGRDVSLKLDAFATSRGLTADALARYLLSLAFPASPSFRADFTSLISGIAIGPPDTAQLQLSRIHVRPESLLQLPPPAPQNAGGFSVAEHTAEQTLFEAVSPLSAQPGSLRAIVEQTMIDDESAVSALLDADVDMLDRVPPWHLDRLRAARNVQVEAYRLPTVHVLIPNHSHGMLAKREFRRALCFGIDRQWIVSRILLGGGTAAGFEVVSGPFPAGTSLSDPVRYAYNNQIAPRSFEPRLAAILATVAASQKAATADREESEEQSPAAPDELLELTLAHPTDPVARLACQSIQAQLERLGIRVKLVQFTADELLNGKMECDLRYAELAVWEPVTDTRRMLGSRSLSDGLQSAYLETALRRLDNASNWNDVRSRLAEVHEIVHHDLPIIPLWQTVNYFAYRTTIRGVGQTPMTLYQNSTDWSPATSGNVAQTTQPPR